ncbi:hypothetical protein ABKN59_009057 [Abortiporus biennis]
MFLFKAPLQRLPLQLHLELQSHYRAQSGIRHSNEAGMAVSYVRTYVALPASSFLSWIRNSNGPSSLKAAVDHTMYQRSHHQEPMQHEVIGTCHLLMFNPFSIEYNYVKTVQVCKDRMKDKTRREKLTRDEQSTLPTDPASTHSIQTNLNPISNGCFGLFVYFKLITRRESLTGILNLI